MLDLASPAAAGFDPAGIDRIDQWLAEQVSSERLAGASALVSRRGKVGYFGTTGHADLDLDRVFARDTIVRIYSMTKPLTNVAAMRLHERGAFELDDPLDRHLPEFSNLSVWKGGDAGIGETVAAARAPTVREVMTHTAGFTYGFMQATPVDAAYREHGIDFSAAKDDLETLVKRLATLPLLRQPGAEWNYSVATDVLGRLVEVWSGDSLETFLEREVLHPLGMCDTGFHVPPASVDRFAAMYAPKRGGGLGGVARTKVATAPRAPSGVKLVDASTGSAFTRPAVAFSGGGGLVGTAMDYARFCQMLLNGGELHGKTILKRETVETMRANHLPGDKDLAGMGQPVWSETSYGGIGFGLGGAVVVDANATPFRTSEGEFHWGGAASTFFSIDPREELFIVFFTQLLPSSTYPLRAELRDLVYAALRPAG